MTVIAEIGWGALRRHRNFRAAVERNAELILAHHDSLTPLVRWLTNDVGRSAMLARALGLQAEAGDARVGDLLASARQRRTASEGRVLQLLERAEAADLIRSTPSSAAWPQRRLVFQAEFIDRFRERVFAEIDSASLALPEIRPALALLPIDAYFRGFLRRLHHYHVIPPEMHGPRNPAIRHFLVREGALKMLYDLIGRQSPDRTRLLEGAPLSRSRLAARIGVSRAHVRRTFDEAAEAGYLTISPDNWITFSKAMSEEAERHFALTFYAIGSSALAAMDDLGLASAPVPAAAVRP
jgi:hypothetical protein